MRTTIDSGGRVVIPKAIRDAAGLAPGTEVEVELHDGRVEIEPTPVEFRLVRRDGWTYIEADRELAPITTDDVRDLLERIRDRR